MQTSPRQTPTPPKADTPLGRHPPWAVPPGKHPQADTPSRRKLKRAVRILLECILVIFHFCFSETTQIKPYNIHECNYKFNRFGTGLTDLPDDIPERTNYINLRRNNIATLPSGNFSHLVSCIFLDLRYNNISVIEPNAFDGLQTLDTLWLSNNSLYTLISDMFQHLDNLDKLYLTGNRIGRIEVNSFAGLGKLTVLDLSDNLLSSLEAGSLTELVSLKELHIDGNRFTTLNAEALEGLPRPLSVAASKPFTSGLHGNVFRCNYLICWLKSEEQEGNIIWYRSAGNVYRPRCTADMEWNLFNWDCSGTSKVFSQLNSIFDNKKLYLYCRKCLQPFKLGSQFRSVILAIIVYVLGLFNRFSTSSVKCWTVNFCIHASKCPVIIMYQLKSLYNSPFKDTYSHPIHTRFAIIASNEFQLGYISEPVLHCSS